MKQYKLILKYKSKSVVLREGVIMDDDQRTRFYIALIEKGKSFYDIFINGEFITKSSTKDSAVKRIKAYFNTSSRKSEVLS